VSVFTDEQGRFAAQAPIGTYGSVVTLLGYRTRAGIWEVATGDTGRVIRLEPDPVVLQGLRVQVRRIERRTRAAGSSARAYDRDALVNTGYPNVLSTFALKDSSLPRRAAACPLHRAAPGVSACACAASAFVHA
jgi:hypothetical protein